VLGFLANLTAFRAINTLCCVCKLIFIIIYKLLHFLKMLHIMLVILQEWQKCRVASLKCI